MSDFVIVALVGFFASTIDGALGMGFGPTSSSLLLASGFSPISTSVMVNFAKVVTGVASAISHWRLGNIERRLVLWLAGPGALGAIFGTTVLVAVDGDSLRPIMALILFAVGLRLFIRFVKRPAIEKGLSSQTHNASRTLRSAGLAGVAGGVTNGLVGAWGPVVTPWLMHRGVEPRFAIGSTNTAEVFVAVVSVGSLFRTAGDSGLSVGVLAAMILGGVVAAPLGAVTVRILPARALGIGVGLLLMLTQGWALAGLLDTWLVVIAAAGAGVTLTLLLLLITRRRQASGDSPDASALGSYESAGSPGVGVVNQ